MTAIGKPVYTLQHIEDFIFNGFDYTVPPTVAKNILSLARMAGAPSNVQLKYTVYRTKVVKPAIVFEPRPVVKPPANPFDTIRSHINKITDKNYVDLRNKIVELVEEIINDTTLGNKISINIFDIASSNRYYSKIYAELFCDLADKFDCIRAEYRTNLDRFSSLFTVVEYADPATDYDRYCDIVKANEKRKALAAFYINLENFGIVSEEEIVGIVRHLLRTIEDYMAQDNKKNEVDEMCEIIGIMYKKGIATDLDEAVARIASSKVKDFKSLTNKTMFKFMDFASQ